ncbi:speckle-type POZ protein-like B [Trichonephila clavipes]|nr:speckle-type POZ protein-like B [Trichonephila clavipes]
MLSNIQNSPAGPPLEPEAIFSQSWSGGAHDPLETIFDCNNACIQTRGSGGADLRYMICSSNLLPGRQKADSKSRVAPLKTLTIPRLELSASLLLSRLVKKVVPILQLPIHKIWMWTDPTIALAWIKTEPHKLKTFVSNRVAEIQALSKDYHWEHVSSKRTILPT